jgi:hypothetical protein
VAPTTVTFQQTGDGKVLRTYELVTDPDAGFTATIIIPTGTRVLSSTGKGVNALTVTPLAQIDVPTYETGVFSFSGFSIECEPAGTTFLPAVTLAFSLNPAQWADALAKVDGNTAAMTIQYYDAAAGAWMALPTSVDPVTHRVSASITHCNIYALFYSIPEISHVTPVTTVETPENPTAELQTPFAPDGTPAALPSPTRIPMVPDTLVIGVIAIVGSFIARKQR